MWKSRIICTGAVAFLCIGLAHAEDALPSTLDSPPAELKRFLSSPALAAVHAPDFVEALPIEEEEGKFKSKYKIIERPVRVDARIARTLSRTLLRVDSYMMDAASACLFMPGIAFRFHKGASVVQVQIGFKCGELIFETLDGKNISERLMLGSGRPGLFSIAKTILPDDQMLIAIDKERAKIEADEKESAAAEKRWLDKIPKSMHSVWESATPRHLPTPDVAILRPALAKEFPNARQRIHFLFALFGSGAGPWSGYPSYEGAAEMLLEDFSRDDLVAAALTEGLTTEQLEGASRFFAGREPTILSNLPVALKKKLYEHSVMSTDEDKLSRAKRAFAQP